MFAQSTYKLDAFALTYPDHHHTTLCQHFTMRSTLFIAPLLLAVHAAAGSVCEYKCSPDDLQISDLIFYL